MRLNLYWNITGRYLGIELPVGEFLSKTDHVPFTDSEYDRLNQILSNPSSPLSNIPYDALAAPDTAGFLSLDGVTGATSKSVTPYIVPGAVYTTYALWHLVYGQTQKLVQKLTEQHLTPALLIHIFNSPAPDDQQWALARMPMTSLSPLLRDKVLGFISDSSYNMAVQTLNSISERQLAQESVQSALMERFNQSGYSIRSLIIHKLSSLDKLSPQAIALLVKQLPQLNGEPLLGVFRILRKQKVKDPHILQAVRKLLDHSNPFVARQAYDYLKFIGENPAKTSVSDF